MFRELGVWGGGRSRRGRHGRSVRRRPLHPAAVSLHCWPKP